ncbi:LEUCINE-RICH REPEAT-CONTAINING PROTEIN [Salix viminalis]|uniref:LEUCINE-RICH REPEAT-CONTAINING PROTEIN n=1 Tax=Salix viminalis TaxID=40686 RepID=A0A9Q0TNT2_SALVM|nr:LEUCINE-RICH REPEAT-CONTAINING PROTEIN [Salix viminalis]
MKLICLLFAVILITFVGFVASQTTSKNETIQVQLVASNNQTSRAWCRSGWDISPNKSGCFKLIRRSKSWNESENHCLSYGGHLAVLTSSEELSFAQKLCGQTASGCWVGGRMTNSTIGFVWKWSDNTSYLNGSMVSESFPLNCTSLSCRNGISADLCTVVNRTEDLMAERCNSSHAFICMLDVEKKCYHMHCHREYLIILAVVSGLILCTTLAVVIWLLAYRRSKKRRKSRKLSNPAASALVPPSWKVFTNEELRSITKNFSEGNRLLGDAKTGGTYSGLLPDGSRVAVKRLKRSSFQRKKEFYSEIGRVARLHHPNLVAIKGCCYDHGDRYIVYEFIVNGPLDRWLHHVPRGGRSLDWAMRMKIATTLAQGIAFLHDKVKPHVVHRDIRASSVLLDEEFRAHLMGSIFEWATPLVQAHRYPELLDPLMTPPSSDVPEAGAIQKVVDLVYACTQHVPSMRPRMSHVVHQLQQLAQP